MTVAPDSRHICDVLIAERAPRLTGSVGWPLVRPFLYALLGYGKARRMADAVAPMGGAEALDHVSKLLALDVKVMQSCLFLTVKSACCSRLRKPLSNLLKRCQFLQLAR